MLLWGQPLLRQSQGRPSAVPSPQATTSRRCYHDTVPPLLEVRHLNIDFPAAALRSGQPGAAVPTQALPAVRDVSFAIAPGEVLGLVGESGSGKSITSLAIMRLLPPQARVSGDIVFSE